MRKAIRHSINGALRQTNSEKTTSDFWIIHYALDLIQTVRGHFGINVQKPKDFAARGAAASVHLCCSIAVAYEKPIAEAPSEIGRAIRASTI